MARTQFENLEVYQLSENLADAIWEIAIRWQNFAQSTVGRQIVRSADSIGANIAEGAGRGSYQDNKRFVKMARGCSPRIKFNTSNRWSMNWAHD